MSTLSAQKIWQLTPAELQKLLDLGQLRPTTNTIQFYAPSFSYYKTPHFQSQTNRFPSVSVTGKRCALKCRHCGGEVLTTMHPATTPEHLYVVAAKLKEAGAEGVLVSGGCLPDGSVPLEGYTEILKRLKEELGLTVFVHTGILNAQSADKLKEAEVDAALIDVVGSEATMQRIFNLEMHVQDYANSLKALSAAELKVVPHVIVGLDDGSLGGEFEALKMIVENAQPAAIVIIAFMPIHGTEMANSKSPLPIDIAKVAACARQMFPDTPLALGCMRPKGKTRPQTDIYALKAGVDAIAYPSSEAIEYAKTTGFQTLFSHSCCAQMYRDLKK